MRRTAQQTRLRPLPHPASSCAAGTTLLLVVMLLQASVLAGEAPPAEVPAPSAVEQVVSWTLSLDPFALGILVLFAATIVGVVVKGRSRDRCLKAYDGFPVEVMLDTASKAGRLRLGNAGFELAPEPPESTPSGRRAGFILYKNEYGRLRSLIRDPAALDKRQTSRRRRRLKRVTRPGVLRRARRWLSNAAGSFKDAFNDFLNLLMGRIQPGAVSQLAKGREKYAGQMRQDITSLLPNSSYDAVLEQLLGRPVEVEVELDNMPDTLVGRLMEYTSTYVSLLDAYIPGGPAGENDVRVEEAEKDLAVVNASQGPVLIPGAGWKLLKPGEKATLPKDAKPVFVRTRTADILIPRTHAVVRFRLEENAA